MYISDNNNSAVRKVTVSTGIITTVAGTGADGFSGDGGPATSATMHDTFGITLDQAGNLYICDYYNYRIRKVTVSTGIISTFAGGGSGGDGVEATSSSLNIPLGVAVDSSGNKLFVFVFVPLLLVCLFP